MEKERMGRKSKHGGKVSRRDTHRELKTMRKQKRSGSRRKSITEELAL